MIGSALTIFVLGQLKVYAIVASAQYFKNFSLAKTKSKTESEEKMYPKHIK